MIITRTPFRISLLGGGTDYPAWYREHGGAVLGTTIDKFCHLRVRRLPPFFDHRFRIVYSKIELTRSIEEIEHPSVRAVLRHIGCESGIEVHHDGDLPARSGMGSSSAFTVGLLHAMRALRGETVSAHELALDAMRLEQEVMHESVGSQDQMLVAHGGFNHVEFQPDGKIRVRPAAASADRTRRLNDYLLLFFSGINRTADKVARSITEVLPTRRGPLARIQALVGEGLKVIEGEHDLGELGPMLHEAWMLKRELSPLVTNPMIDDLYASARNAGALGGKLLGAGGGGFLLIFAPPDRHDAVISALSRLVHVPFRFETEGSRTIFADPRKATVPPEPRREIEPFRDLADPSPEIKRDLYGRMQRIRKVELRIEEEYPGDEMVTPVHLCIGQEAVAVGACDPLRREDYVSSNFRGHGHYLAKGGNLNAFMAELYSRATGCAGGFGGSMHLVDPAVGIHGSSAIVAGGVPIGVGLALAARMQGQDRISLVFFGDGAVEEGAFYESVNFAMLKKLPVVFVLENNRWSICSPLRQRQVAPTLFHQADPAHLLTRRVDGNDVVRVREAAEEAVERARAGRGPALIECSTYRIRQHVGPGSDVHLGHRTAEEVAEWEQRCPIRNFRKRLLAENILTEDDLGSIDRELDTEIEAAIRFARSSPRPAPEEMEKRLYRRP